MDRKSRARQLAREADPALSDEESAAILGLVNIGDEKALDLFDDLNPAEVAGVVKWYLKQREAGQSTGADIKRMHCSCSNFCGCTLGVPIAVSAIATAAADGDCRLLLVLPFAYCP